MQESIDVDGITRNFTVVDGDAKGDRRRDLLLIFHGSKQTGEVHRRFTGGMFDSLADRGGAVVAYLDGYKGNWNDARRQSYFPARLENIDDVAFTRQVIHALVASRQVDPQRVFAVGYSNGGQMVFRLIHEAPDLFAGAAVFSATLPAPDSFAVAEAGIRPIPVLLAHGTADPIAPFEGGSMRGWAKRLFKVGGTTWSMAQTAQYFAKRNGIAESGVDSRISPPTSRKVWVSQTEYRPNGRPPVRAITVHGGGHTIPGPKKAPFVLGRTSSDITAAQEVASFFGLGSFAD